MKRKVLRKPREWNTEGYKVFIKDTESLKIRKAYDRLKNKLSLKTQRMSHESLIQALDSASDDYVLACDLFLIAKDEMDKFQIHYDIEMSKYTSEAHTALEKKKKAKTITSQITESLKKSWVYEHHEEKVKELEETKRQLKIVRLRMEILKDAWEKRMSSLQSQARAIESQRQIRLGRGGKDGSEE